MNGKSFTWAQLEIDQQSGNIRAIHICAGSDQEEQIVQDALARIISPNHWQRLRWLLTGQWGH